MTTVSEQVVGTQWGGPHLIDVRDELPLSGHVDLLVVGSHLTLDGKEQNLQVALLCEPEEEEETFKTFSDQIIQPESR